MDSSRKKLIFALIAFIALTGILLSVQDNMDNKQGNKKEPYEISSSNSEKILDQSFKSFLKEKGLSMDIGVPNKYETLQPGNKYSNHHFNISTDFPDNWEFDRGVGDYSVFRCFQEDSAITMALLIVPVQNENAEDRLSSHLAFQNSPLDYLNGAHNGDYTSFLKEQFIKNTTSQIYDFQLDAKKVRTSNYVISTYKFDEVVENIRVPFICCTYQTIMWGTNFSIMYNVPEIFYNQKLIDDVVFKTNYIKP